MSFYIIEVTIPQTDGTTSKDYEISLVQPNDTEVKRELLSTPGTIYKYFKVDTNAITPLN